VIFFYHKLKTRLFQEEEEEEEEEKMSIMRRNVDLGIACNPAVHSTHFHSR